jgi:hypothetical protein
MEKLEKIKWTESKINLHFRLKRNLKGLPLLTKWFDVTDNLTDLEKTDLEKRRLTLLKKVNFWNEEELKMKFLSHLLDMAEYEDNDAYFDTYLDREIVALVEGIELKTKADYLIASGFGEEIQSPYFCFHEYKRKKRNADDPVAQVLLGMLIAQEINKNGKPIYGCHIIGEFWFFMILQGKEYAIAKALDATDEKDLQQIVLILRKFKTIIMNELLN